MTTSFLEKRNKKRAYLSNTLVVPPSNSHFTFPLICKKLNLLKKQNARPNLKRKIKTLRKSKIFLPRLADSHFVRVKQQQLNRKSLQDFPKFFLSEKTLKCSAIFPALTSSREKFLHLEPYGLFNSDVICNSDFGLNIYFRIRII